MKKKILILSLCLFFIACDNSYFPKPRGFFRIDLPQKNYISFDSIGFPYSFFIPDYVEIKPDYENINESHWIDLYYTPFDASLHISYKKVNNNLNVYLDDARTFVNKHIPKANAIQENLFVNESQQVYGLVYTIEGSDAASPLQFYLTDSTTHFIRAALYFNFTPNNDSLEPVINFIKQDISFMIESFKWK